MDGIKINRKYLNTKEVLQDRKEWKKISEDLPKGRNTNEDNHAKPI